MGETFPRHSLSYWICAVFVANVALVGLTLFAVRLAFSTPTPTFLAAGRRCVTCWQGISPGKTSILEVLGLLNSSGLNFAIAPQGYREAIAVEAPHGWLKAFMFPSFAGFRADPRIAMFCLRDDDQTGGLILGDVLTEIGPPDELHFQDNGYGNIRIDMRYRTRLLEVTLIFAQAHRRFTLFDPVDSVCFEPAQVYPAPSAVDVSWHGAASISRYYPELRIGLP